MNLLIEIQLITSIYETYQRTSRIGLAKAKKNFYQPPQHSRLIPGFPIDPLARVLKGQKKGDSIKLDKIPDLVTQLEFELTLIPS